MDVWELGVERAETTLEVKTFLWLGCRKQTPFFSGLRSELLSASSMVANHQRSAGITLLRFLISGIMTH